MIWPKLFLEVIEINAFYLTLLLYQMTSYPFLNEFIKKYTGHRRSHSKEK
jgi:hypothetical protein